MAEKQLVVAIECTAAMGPYWDTILKDYLDKIIRSFGGSESTGQKPSASNVEFALVTYNTHGCDSGSVVQRTGWTSDPDVFFLWLSAVPFTGGGFNDAAIAEGLAEALMMFPNSQSGGPNQQNVDMHKHCILVAASNPYPLKTPVYVPRPQNLEKSETIDSDPGNGFYDAEAVAKAFPQFSISLSVICPRQLPEVKAIYNAGNQTSRAADPPVDVKTPHFLILIPEAFREASSALSRSGITTLPTNQSPVKVDAVSVTPGTGAPPNSLPSDYGSTAHGQPISAWNLAPATVKVEAVPVASMVAGPAFPRNLSVPRAACTGQGVPSLQTSSPSFASQDIMTSTENGQDTKPMASMLLQPLGPVNPAQVNVNILNNLSQAPQVMNSAALSGRTSMGLPSMGQTPVAMHMSNMISSGMASSVPAAQNVFSSELSGIISITSSGLLTFPAQVGQNSSLGSLNLATSNLSCSNLEISQPLSNLQGAVSMGQGVPGMSQGNISGAQMVQGGVTMNQNVMNGLGPSVVSSGNGTMIPTPGMSQQVQSGEQPLVNSTAPNMTLPQQTSGGMQPTQSKYIKVWEGRLSVKRQGQPVLFITEMEGYRSLSAPETIAANWPPVMQIVRLISQDDMRNEQFVGKADFLVFRVMNPHGFLVRLQEKKLCGVIQLPSHTLLLSFSDQDSSLIGMLLPRVIDMAAFKPQLSSQQQQHMQQPQLMQSQKQQLPHLQQQQLLQLEQQQQLMQLQQQQQHMQQPQLMQSQQHQLPHLQLQQQQHMQQPLMQSQQQQLPHLQQQQLSQLQQQHMQQPLMQSQQLQLHHLQQQQLLQLQQQQQQLIQLQQQQQQKLQEVQQQLSQLQQQQLPQLQQQQLSQLQPQQQVPQLQQLQHQQLPQQQLMVAAGMGQASFQDPVRSQRVSQGQVSQGATNIGGWGFMS